MTGAEVVELVGVYNAEGSLRGELTYLVGKVTGRTHCALCDITHGTLRRRPAFDRCVAALPVPFRLLHLDEQPADIAAVSAAPCVLARTGAGLVPLLDAELLDQCGRDPARLIAAMEDRMRSLDLRFAQPVS